MNTENTKLTPYQTFNVSLDNRKDEFIAALPNGVTYEKFARVAKTSVVSNPDLITADRNSLMLSCLKSAQDGLLPDGRESAFVVYNTKDKATSGWKKMVQYMPMYQGILKKIRNSGELLSIGTHVVYKTDKFELSLGDDEKIVHIPDLDSEQNVEDALCVYCIAKTKDGGIYREIMSVKQINKIRNKSKAYTPDKSCIWNDHWEEMAKKTVIRRLSKRLPSSTDLELYDEDYNNSRIEVEATEVNTRKPIKFVPTVEKAEQPALTAQQELTTEPTLDISNAVQDVQDYELEDIMAEVSGDKKQPW